MIEFDNLSSVSKHVGQNLGTSAWRTISQADINAFADVTGDRQWIHIDPVRCQQELGLPTVAHGYLTLSLIPVMLADTFRVKSVKRMINYGSNKVRFLAPVAAGSRVRGHVALIRGELDGVTMRAVFSVNVEIDGDDRPALSAEVIALMHE